MDGLIRRQLAINPRLVLNKIKFRYLHAEMMVLLCAQVENVNANFLKVDSFLFFVFFSHANQMSSFNYTMNVSDNEPQSVKAK